MTHPLVEICVASVAECQTAEACGADRLELNSGLQLGGLTPSSALAQRAVDECELPIVAMIRPRPGGFCYDSDDWQTLLADAKTLTKMGIHGLAFGCLTTDRNIDIDKVKQLRELCPDTELVFHRAFDLVADGMLAVEQLVDCGVKRIMTSGFAPSVPQGLNRIAEIIKHADGRAEVIPAGGINEQNVIEVVNATGCDQVHGTFSSEITDPGYLDAPIRFAANDSLRRVDATKVAAVIASLRKLSK